MFQTCKKTPFAVFETDVIQLCLIIWLIPTLKQLLLSVSSSALRLCGKVGWSTSFEKTHSSHNRATPTKMMLYKHALELYTVHNSEDMNEDWIDLNQQQNFNGRVQCVQIFDKSRIRVGRNILMNRLSIISDKINYDWLNLTRSSYKTKCKGLFLSWMNEMVN